MLSISILLLSVFCEVFNYETPISMNCGSYDRTLISSKLVNYTGDSFFEGITSTAETKEKIPDGISNLADRELIKSHRTTNEDYTHFSYMPVLEPNGHHIAIFTLVQTEYKMKNERIFHIKLGQQIVHTVDVFAEAGYGKLLHKWIEFQIRDDIAYLNGTIPALNAYNYNSNQIKFTFESVKGKAKVEALIIVKGTDTNPFLYRFLQYEQEKNIIKRQYLADKYRRIPLPQYSFLRQQDIIAQPLTQFQKIMSKFISLRSIGCILCALFAIHHKEFINYLQRKIDALKIDLNKNLNKNKKE